MKKRIKNKRTTTSRQSASKPKARGSFWQGLLQREIWGLALATLGVVTVIALVSPTQGKLSEAWSLILRQIFGVGAYPVALFMIASGVVILLGHSFGKRFSLRWQVIVGVELFFFAGLGLLHVVARGSPLELAKAGRFGGYIGLAAA